MKKIVLIALALGVGFATYAQNQKTNSAVHKVSPVGLTHKAIADPTTVNPVSIGPAKQSAFKVKGPKIGTVNQIYFATSGNILTVEDANYTCLSSCPGLNLVAFTHRGGGNDGTETSNYIRCKYTSNNGASFDSLDFNISQGTNNRYPSGVIINPTGNTIANQAYMGYVGPYWTGSSSAPDWAGSYAGSARLDGDTNVMLTNYIKWDTTNPIDLVPGNLASCDGNTKMVHACLPYSLTVTTDLQYVTPPLYAEVFNGTLGTSPTSDSLVWDTTLVKINFMAVANDNPGVYLFNYGSAWNEDGSVGYIYFFGVDSTDRPFHYSVEPIVYKSTTHGATWVKQPVFNFSTISTIEDSIRPVDNDATLRIPFIPGGDASGNEQAGSVDNNGQLHIVTGVYGGSSSDPDSAAYSYTGDVERLYDIHTKVGGGWDATYITAMQCAIVSPTDPGALYYSSTQNIGWNHRIHISRTTDGTKMFATWIDDTLTTSVTMVTLPELMAYGWDNTNGHHTQLTNFTSNTAFDGTCYWKYAADRVLTSGSTYTIPVTTTLPNTTALATDPCTHYYLTGVTFDDADFVGINELKNNVSFVSQNYPNPFDKTTTISVKLSTPSNLTLLVSNMLGQKVYEMNYGTVSAGTHTYTFDGSKLQSGIYFYTVKAGEDSDTHKMVIE